MPRDAEKPLAGFAHAIATAEGFSFGEPQLSDDGSLVTLPILKDVPHARPFVLAAEVSDALSAVDVGRRDRLQIRNDSAVRVFLPPGTLFEGRGTAARGTCAGTVLDPGTASEIRVRCVQAVQPIREGAGLRIAPGLAPHPLAQALLSLDQGLVWATAASSDESLAEPRPAIPSSAAECGLVLLDADGVVAAEVCDGPESWRVLSRRWTPSRDRTPRLALNPAGAVRVAAAFFDRLPRRSFQEVSPGGSVAMDASVAWTAIGGAVVHLLAFGRDLTVPATGPGAAAEVSSLASEDATPSLAEPTFAAATQDDAEVAVAAASLSHPADEADASPAVPRPRRRKVLTSGWDGPTFESLERLSRKEFRGDRSAAIRFLVRQGLRQRGYMGPLARPSPSAAVLPAEAEEPSPEDEGVRASAEARALDLERIATTEAYAPWVRKRARLELERIAAAARDEVLGTAARSALDRLPTEAPSEEPVEEVLEPEIAEAPAPSPPPPAVDVRPLLRRAFAASAAAQYPEALALFDRVLAAEPDNRTAFLGRAVALRRSGKAQEALEALDAVLRAEPANAAALLHRGRLLMERGDLAGALETFDRLAAAAPNDWDVWMARGDLLAKMGRDRDALQAYHEALRRNPEDESLGSRIRELEQAKPAPVPPAAQRIQLPREVQEGQTYLVKERRPDLSFRILQALAARSVPALVLTRRPAEAIRSDARLAAARIVELSHAPGEGRQDPTALGALTSLLEHFVRQNAGHGVIVLDGLASLVLENGFRETILFIERVHETVLQSQAVFLLSLAPGDLGEREEALLERNLRTLA